MRQETTNMDVQKNTEAQALRQCLDELVEHAEAQGLSLAANLIGAASRAVSDEMFKQELANRALADGLPRLKLK